MNGSADFTAFQAHGDNFYVPGNYCLRFSGPSPGEKDAFPATPSLFTKEEAFQYLKLREIDKEQAAQIYELVGGRMIHLKYMAEKITTNGTFEGMYTACYTKNGFLPPLQICARRCCPI
jgi:hypothetical protein